MGVATMIGEPCLFIFLLACLLVIIDQGGPIQDDDR